MARPPAFHAARSKGWRFYGSHYTKNNSGRSSIEVEVNPHRRRLQHELTNYVPPAASYPPTHLSAHSCFFNVHNERSWTAFYVVYKSAACIRWCRLDWTHRGVGCRVWSKAFEAERTEVADTVYMMDSVAWYRWRCRPFRAASLQTASTTHITYICVCVLINTKVWTSVRFVKKSSGCRADSLSHAMPQLRKKYRVWVKFYC